mgnify:CR=1 FL=1
MILSVNNIHVSYGRLSVVRGLSFSLERGEIGCLLGASGCGKTTALRTIAGFERLLSGEIAIGSQLVSSADVMVAPEKRSVGMVFQDQALFPHLRVIDNVGFGLRSMATQERLAEVDRLLDLTGLMGLGQRYPHELSGGQQQRVALARALAPEPAVLLLDEPFSNLDTGLRRGLGEEVREILKQRGTAALLVTHDQEEAFALADKIGLMEGGRMLQWASPYELYHQPATPYVAAFTGRGSYLSAEVNDEKLVHPLGFSPKPTDLTEHGEYLLLVRPDDLRVDPQGTQVTIVGRQFQGAEMLYRLALQDGSQISALFPSRTDYQVGQSIGISFVAKEPVVFPKIQSASSTNPLKV